MFQFQTINGTEVEEAQRLVDEQKQLIADQLMVLNVLREELSQRERNLIWAKDKTAFCKSPPQQSTFVKRHLPVKPQASS